MCRQDTSFLFSLDIDISTVAKWLFTIRTAFETSISTRNLNLEDSPHQSLTMLVHMKNIGRWEHWDDPAARLQEKQKLPCPRIAR